MKIKDFPGGIVDKNSPANAGNTSLIPGPGRFHMLWNNLSSCATATGPALESLALPREKPPQWEARTTREQPSLTETRERLYAATKTQCGQE